MDDETLPQYYSSATVGAYRPNTILTRMKSEADLNPEFGDVAPIALPAHVHEYIHHLHNYTTRTGVLQFYITFLIYRLFVEGVNEDGEFSPAAASVDTQNILIEAGRLLVSIDGTCSHRPKNLLPRNEEVRWVFTVREKKIKSFVDISTTAVTGSVSSNHKSEYFEFTVGHTFLTEGVAYCIDREIRRNQGMEDHILDFGVPIYPYLVYRPLLNHLVGRHVTVLEEILIGVAAMMGESLIHVCKIIKESADKNNALLPIIKNAAQELNEKINTQMLPLLIKTRSEFSEGDHLFSAIDQLITLIDEGQKLRSTWPALERSFIEKQLDKDTYLNLIAILLDVCIMQEKPEQTGEFFWGGSGRIAGNDKAATNLAVLQASIHFVRLHLRRNGNLGSTNELPFERCPFSGACATEKELSNPEVCIKTPWRRFSEMRVNSFYCWYAAGVSVLTSYHSKNKRSQGQ